MLKTSALATVWQHRNLLRALVVRDIQNRYTGSVAGLLWALLHPLLMLGIYGVVFEYIFLVRIPTLSAHQPYVLFVAATMWPWLAFQEAVTRGTMAIQNHAGLVKKVAFPHELLIYSAVLAGFMLQLFGFFVVLLVMRMLGWAVSFSAWPLVLISVVTLLLMAGVCALLLGALQVFVRDVEHLLAQVLSVLFYATPILYAMASVPPWLGSAMQWNPLVHVLEPIRSALLGGARDSYPDATIALCATLVLFFLARRFFLKLSPHFEDMV